MPRYFIAILALINLLALFQGITPFFLTFADLPIVGHVLPSCELEVVARALGHANHEGGESMRNLLLKSLPWLLGVGLLNFLVAAIAIVKGRIAAK